MSEDLAPPSRRWPRRLARARDVASRAVVALLAMSGIFVTGLDGPRAAATAFTAGTSVLLLAARYVPPFETALVAFAAGFAIRYAVLFLSFIPGGIADCLKRRHGAERGFSRYQALTAVLFHARGLTFSWLVAATQRSLEGTVAPWLRALGLALALAGALVNVWSTLVIGLDRYFYRDLFMNERAFALKAEGPYRYFRNPMYGIGQGAAYGAALAAFSGAGLLATALNQAFMYLFNWRVEQPHLAVARRAGS
jgi:protein-S-isoprenylcysteine O-methyltransferase Ste14